MLSPPVIDLADVEDDVNADINKLRDLGGKVKQIFKTFGFCYLRNHGVHANLISSYMEVSRKFFEQPVELKQKYAIGSDIKYGWVGFDQQALNPERPADLKEMFSYSPFLDLTVWPGEEKFEKLTKEMYRECTLLAGKFFNVLSYSLDLPADVMRNAHKSIGKEGNTSAIRTLYYPPIKQDYHIKQDQIRLGEHDDYGTITFLFQDCTGGLDMMVPGGEFVSATPIAGSILVIVGSLLERWTAGLFIAAIHRVLIPEEEIKMRKCRQSVVFFVEPDDDVIIKCLDGSNKYEPVRTIDYLNYRRTRDFVK